LVDVNFELWNIGFQNEGTKIDDFKVPVDSTIFTIGNWWDSSIDTNFKGSIDLDIPVSAADLLGLKFIRITGNSNAVSIYNSTIILEIEEN
jgi:hypothetical protein